MIAKDKTSHLQAQLKFLIMSRIMQVAKEWHRVNKEKYHSSKEIIDEVKSRLRRITSQIENNKIIKEIASLVEREYLETQNNMYRYLPM